MKKKLFMMAAFAAIFCVSGYSQDVDNVEQQELLKRSDERMVKKQQLFEEQKGHHFGLAYDMSAIVGNDGGVNLGLLFSYGNRLSEHWMLGAMAGIDFLGTPTVTYKVVTARDVLGWVKETIVKEKDRPRVSFPIMGEVRFYFGSARFMPYWVTNLGVSISKYSGVIFNTGLGADISLKNQKTIFISTGIGTTPVPGFQGGILGAPVFEPYETPELTKAQPFTFNIRLGCYF